MFQKILIAVDGSYGGERAAQVGLGLAGRLGSRVVLVHVLDGWSTAPPRLTQVGREEARAQGQTLLTRWQAGAAQRGLEVEIRLRELTEPAEGIVAVAQQEDCDLIVMGTHSREGLARLLLGSVAERASRLAPVPVLLVRSTTPTSEPVEFRRVLVPIDGSELSNLALDQAKKLVGYLGAKLLVLFVEPRALLLVLEALEEYPEEQEKYLHRARSLIDQAVQDFPEAEAIWREAGAERIGDVIAQVAKERGVDLIVMGTHGRTGLDRVLLGSVAERVTHRAHCAVLLVRQAKGGSVA
jgi:nucleotide-binding universal stress UspA family protein